MITIGYRGVDAFGIERGGQVQVSDPLTWLVLRMDWRKLLVWDTETGEELHNR